MRRATWNRSRGVALIMALLVFALVSAVTIAMFGLLARERDVVARVTADISIKQQLLGAEAWATYAFASLDEAQLPSIATQRWLLKQQMFALETPGDSVLVSLVDRHSCLNLNALADEKLAEKTYASLRRLLVALGQNAELADMMRDWVDIDQDLTGARGREDEYYQGLTPSFRTGDTPLISESEMWLWPWPEGAATSIMPWLCLWPIAEGAHINRLPPPLIAAWLPELTAEQRATLDARLASAGFDSVSAFLQEPALAEITLNAQDWREKMAFVDAFIRVKMAGRTQWLHARLHKNTQGEVSTYYRAFGPYEPVIGLYGITEPLLE